MSSPGYVLLGVLAGVLLAAVIAAPQWGTRATPMDALNGMWGEVKRTFASEP